MRKDVQTSRLKPSTRIQKTIHLDSHSARCQLYDLRQGPTLEVNNRIMLLLAEYNIF